LANVLKIFSYETAGQMNRTLVGGIYGRFSIKIAHFKKIFKTLANQKQELPVAAMFVNGS
jgi:hypothetical protein